MRLSLIQKIYINTIEILIKLIWMIYHFIFNKIVAFPIITLNKKKYKLSLKKISLSKKSYERIKNISTDSQKALIYSKKFKLNSHFSEKERYVHDLENILTNKSYISLLNICSDKNLLKHAQLYLGSRPYLSGIQVYANIVDKNSSIQEGSKLWHRDSNVLHNAEYYINLTKVLKENGRLQIIKAPKNNWLLFPKTKIKKGWSFGYRFNNNEMNNFYRESLEDLIFTNEGEIGLVTFIDSGLNFHKGGDIKKGERIVIRITYTANPFYAANSLIEHLNKFNGFKENRKISNNILNHLKKLDNKFFLKSILLIDKFLMRFFNRLRIFK